MRGLRKAYGEKVVLDGLDLDIAAGSIFALLGPNGAGKTTVVNILSTLVAADGGERERRRPRPGARSRRGARGDRRHRPVLRRRRPAHRRGEPRPDGRPAPPGPGRRTARGPRDLLERFDLVEAARKPAATYSGGMRRRLDLAMGLVGRPQVLFLDEPTTGLDPRSRRALWEMIRELAATGVTVLLTTQYLEEADQLADRIAVLDHGRIVAAGTADELKSLVPGGHVRLTFADAAGFDAAARVLHRRRPGRRRAGAAGRQRRHRPRDPRPAGRAGPPRRQGRPAVRAHPRPRRRVPRPHRAPGPCGGDLPMTTRPSRCVTARRCCAASCGTCSATPR